MRKGFIFAAIAILVVGLSGWGLYARDQRIKRESCEALLNLSVVNLKSEERSEVRQIGSNPEELRKLLLTLHREKMTFWKGQAEFHYKMFVDHMNSGITDHSQYAIEATLKDQSDQDEAIRQAEGFRVTGLLLSKWHRGMTEKEIEDFRKSEDKTKEMLAEAEKRNDQIHSEFRSRLASKEKYSY